MTMTRSFTALFAALLTFATLLAIAPQAFAQTTTATTVIIVDQARVMRDSRAGKDVQAKVKAIGETMRNEIKPEGDALEIEEKSLNAQMTGKTPQAIQADAALRQRFESFRTRAAAYGQKRAGLARDLQATEVTAWNKFNEQLRPVLQEVINERGASIVIDRSQVVFANPSVDVTDVVIQKLDARVPTVTVARIKAPTPTAPTTTQ